MIVVKVEIWPDGDEHKKRGVSRVNIWNISSDKEANLQNYQYAVVEPDAFDGNTLRHGKVKNHNWKQSVWELIKEMVVD